MAGRCQFLPGARVGGRLLGGGELGAGRRLSLTLSYHLKSFLIISLAAPPWGVPPGGDAVGRGIPCVRGERCLSGDLHNAENFLRRPLFLGHAITCSHKITAQQNNKTKKKAGHDGRATKAHAIRQLDQCLSIDLSMPISIEMTAEPPKHTRSNTSTCV